MSFLVQTHFFIYPIGLIVKLCTNSRDHHSAIFTAPRSSQCFPHVAERGRTCGAKEVKGTKGLSESTWRTVGWAQPCDFPVYVYSVWCWLITHVHLVFQFWSGKSHIETLFMLSHCVFYMSSSSSSSTIYYVISHMLVKDKNGYAVVVSVYIAPFLYSVILL